MDELREEIIDAAIEVSSFARDNDYPEINTQKFFEFADKLDALRTALRKVYPNC